MKTLALRAAIVTGLLLSSGCLFVPIPTATREDVLMRLGTPTRDQVDIDIEFDGNGRVKSVKNDRRRA